ncbi:hypothetical protein SARC_09761 [Sphaeroforma arctica JP610]|uniref:Uncharacterized protein n=1 Tax=Sphaeroforma arctica JP610 TaxID=667725 RepID=A0A0L0FLY2_9EUKA|nr:hypothetical protein SARC_09761 [Sphaeroforma arctica JP610]KNC77787.1 hypothetical protein SARC_09761 [Sphaeroforma arctica JP610]|eukprot:XP_014151689.1 hypothetical protein SARC_09761 [Sphaeroforma arctica JP610]
MLKVVFLCILIALWSTSCADKDADELARFQKKYGLKNQPAKKNTKAFKSGEQIGLSVDIEGLQVDFWLEQHPVIPSDGVTIQYTFGCISEVHEDIDCSVTLFPNGDVLSMLVFWGDHTWICEGVGAGDGQSMCYKAADMEESNFEDLIVYPERMEGRSTHVRRHAKAEPSLEHDLQLPKNTVEHLDDGSDFGYLTHAHTPRSRRATSRTVQLRMTYDRAYLVALAESENLGASQATIAQADQYTMMLVNHLNTIYVPQVGINFELYPTSRVPNTGAVNGNYGTSTASGTILTNFTTDTANSNDDLNVLFSGVDLAGNTIGVAYIATACRKSYNNGLLTPLGVYGGIYSQVSVFAHEVGHNFGCGHFDDPADIMYPSNNGAREFGATCRATVEQHINNIEVNEKKWYQPACFEVQTDSNPCFAAVGDGGVCGFGLCIASDSTYTCDCTDSDYTGDNCEVPINQCPADGVGQCQNGGKCVDSLRTYTCDCQAGFEGYVCQYETCAANPCTSGNTCTDVTVNGQITGFTCTCENGATGDRCEIMPEVNECASNPCGVGGTCTDDVDSYSCTCATGYSLSADKSTCIDTNDCASNPCTRGTCTDQLGGYVCDCTNTGYTGLNCQENIDDCATNPCGVGGKCTDGVNAYSCSCAAGYSASANKSTCIDTDDCANNPCNAGTCTDQLGGYVCDCSNTGYTGVNCQEDVDECDQAPCASGTCINRPGTFSCVCDEGFAGVLCDQDAGACDSSPCPTGQACTPDSSSSGYTCGCADGFAGPDCGTRIGTCADGDACKNGATCTTNEDRSYTCACAPGYTGTRCAAEINECITANTCVIAKTKTCTDKLLGITCTCKPGWGGDNCEEYTCDCGDGICEEDYYENPVCNCPPGYSGVKCEIGPLLDSTQTNACVNEECANRGNCENVEKPGEVGVTTAQCNCFGGYDGTYCDTVTYDPCEGNPCSFGGTCRASRFGSFSCTCVPGRLGTTCEIDVNECASNPCVGGTCSNNHNTFRCTCTTGWYGQTCSSRTPV